jgi:ankyrin repeat protein
MLSFLKIVTLIGLLLWQVGCAQARPAVDYKVLATLIKNNQTAALRDNLRRYSKSDINLQGRTTLTALAISQNRTEAVSALLDWGVDANRTLAFEVGNEKLDISPLIYAISSKASLEVVELLVQRGANVNQASDTLLPLNFALSLRQYVAANYLIDRGANVNGVTGVNDMTPVMELSFYAESDLAAMQNLFAKMVHGGAKVNAKTAKGTSALVLAATFGKTALVQLLLESGADPNTVNGKGDNVLALAKQKKHDEIVAVLLKFGAKL